MNFLLLTCKTVDAGVNITKTVSILAVSALLSNAAYANTSDSIFALGAKVGTAGVGIEGRNPITENLYGRFGVNYLHYNHSLSNGALNYKGNLTLLTVPLMLDYHLFIIQVLDYQRALLITAIR